MAKGKNSKSQRLKYIKTNKYEILFNLDTGFEIMQGINGHPDPFSLEFPSLLDIGVMGHCKNDCDICYQGDKKESNMSLNNFKKIINEAKKHTNQVALGGRGDPNHHKNFKEIVEYCVQNNVIPNYTTSGIGLTDEHIEISKQCGAVAVSDYEQTHTYEAIRRFMDAGIKTNIHIVLTKKSYFKAVKILYGYNPWNSNTTVAKEYDGTLVDIDRLNAVIFLLFKPQGKGKQHQDLIPTNLQLHVFSDLSLKSKADFKIGMDSCLVNYVSQISKPSNIQKMSIDTCEGARMSAYISPNMKFIPCSFCDHDIQGVQIKNKDLKFIWNKSRKFKSFRNELRKNPNHCPARFL